MTTLVFTVYFQLTDAKVKCEGIQIKSFVAAYAEVEWKTRGRATRLSATADKDEVDPPCVPSTRRPGRPGNPSFPQSKVPLTWSTGS